MGLLRFVGRVVAWPVRIALFLLGLVLFLATSSAFIEQGASLPALLMLLATATCFEARRALR